MCKRSKVTNRQLKRENLRLQREIFELHKKLNKLQSENVITKDSISEYEEWLDSPEGDKLVQAYADYYNAQEVAIEGEPTQYTDDAKDRMAKSHLWL